LLSATLYEIAVEGFGKNNKNQRRGLASIFKTGFDTKLQWKKRLQDDARLKLLLLSRATVDASGRGAR